MPIRPLPVALLFLLALPVRGQDAPIDTTVVAEDPPSTRDIRALHLIYDIEAPAFAAVMRGANWSSQKTFLGAVPAHWLGTLALGDGDYQPAYLMTLAEAGTVGAVFALKNVVRRPRPYASLSDITPRARGHPTAFDPYSFPSGHAAVSFALATSVSLSYPEWYVVAPAFGWALAVSVSRSWLGVHYPVDTAIGAAMGTGITLGVHALGDLITPGFLRGADPLAERPVPPSVRFVISL